jgi:hypothetical protein
VSETGGEGSAEFGDTETAEESFVEPAAEELFEADTVEESGGDEFLDELEFLESLSLDDPESFDAVSKMLEDEGEGAGEEDESDKGGAG